MSGCGVESAEADSATHDIYIYICFFYLFIFVLIEHALNILCKCVRVLKIEFSKDIVVDRLFQVESADRDRGVPRGKPERMSACKYWSETSCSR